MAAQIIRIKRGALEKLSNITGSLQKGELLIVTGSSNITSTNGSSIMYVATENGQVQAVNRFIKGNTAPNAFTTYGGLLDGVPYFDSGSGTLYLLGSGSNEAISLLGNIQPFSSSIALQFSASQNTTTTLSQSVATNFSASSAELVSVSSSISTSLALGLSSIQGFLPPGVISSSQQVIDILNNITNFSAITGTIDNTFATDNELELSSSMDGGEF